MKKKIPIKSGVRAGKTKGGIVIPDTARKPLRVRTSVRAGTDKRKDSLYFPESM